MFGHQDDQQTINGQSVAATDQNDWSENDNESDTASLGSQPDTHTDAETAEPNPPVVHEEPSVSAPSPTVAASDDLLAIKQQALGQLSPIVNHLDQSPEEKFRTTMMMIQASDDQSLIKTAYEAAQQITDEKQKAQALLDIVNEINYFTHQGQPS